MLSVALHAVLRDGDFGPLHLGMARPQVRALLGRPEATTTNMDKRGRPIMWRYGDIELTYDPDGDGLVAVQVAMPHLHVPSGWRRLILDPWVLRGGLSPEEVERSLQGAGIPWKRLPARFPGDYLVLETGTGGRLGFVREESNFGSPHGLHYLLLMDWSKW